MAVSYTHLDVYKRQDDEKINVGVKLDKVRRAKFSAKYIIADSKYRY